MPLQGFSYISRVFEYIFASFGQATNVSFDEGRVSENIPQRRYKCAGKNLERAVFLFDEHLAL